MIATKHEYDKSNLILFVFLHGFQVNSLNVVRRKQEMVRFHYLFCQYDLS